MSKKEAENLKTVANEGSEKAFLEDCRKPAKPSF